MLFSAISSGLFVGPLVHNARVARVEQVNMRLPDGSGSCHYRKEPIDSHPNWSEHMMLFQQDRNRTVHVGHHLATFYSTMLTRCGSRGRLQVQVNFKTADYGLQNGLV